MLDAVLRKGALIALVAFAGSVTGCDKRKLEEVEVPDEGVQLAYDLTAGAAFDGHIRVSNTLGSPAGEIYNAIEYDVSLMIAEPKGDKSLVRATVTSVTVDSRLPEGLPKQAALSRKAAEAADGMELRFYVDAHGEVTEPPEPPADAPMEVKAVIALVATGLKAAFVKLPPGPIKQGDSWDTSPQDQPDGATISGSGTMSGLARDADSGEDMAKLEYKSDMQRSGEGDGAAGAAMLKGALAGTTKALFSKKGYAASIERRLNGEAAGMTLAVGIDVDWTPKG